MTILEEIIIHKNEEVNLLLAVHNEAGLRDLAEHSDPPRDLVTALRHSRGIPVIAEIKKASPSAGKIKEIQDVAKTAQAYHAGGAAALSVLTDKRFFGGDLVDLQHARSNVPLPVMRKDFIIDKIQLYQSRIAGADAVLLIAGALSPLQLQDLYDATRALGMAAIVEVHGEDELAPVLDLQPQIVGINNRNLKTMEVDLETSVRLRKLIPPGPLVVAESGISKREEVIRLRDEGIDAFLVGTTLMKADDPETALSELCRPGD